MSRRRPTLPRSRPRSTIGAGGLNFRVRDGTGCDPSAMATETLCRGSLPAAFQRSWLFKSHVCLEQTIASVSEPRPRPISTGRLHVLPRFHLRPINPLASRGPYRTYSVGGLILERASRLDAFSGYLFRTSPTSHALGRTTGTREVRPSRSSRTRDSLPQASCAHGG